MNNAPQIPRVGIFCKQLEKGGDPFSSDRYWQAYQDLLLALKEKGVEAYLLTDNNSYRGFGEFKTAYTISQKTSLDNLEEHKDVTINLVFDRGGFIGRDVATVNPPILTKIASSKIEMYEYFTNLQPRSFIGKTKRQVIKALKRLPGEKIVVKEPEGSGGKQVYIGDKEQVLAELPKSYPLLVQEFLDTSQGVPGQVKGAHDVRLSLCGGKIISYYVRTPAKGRLHANLAQGGSMQFFDVKDVPKKLLKAVRDIDDLFRGEPRYYAVDFMNTPKGWKLVEINSYLGLNPVSEGKEAREEMEQLSNYLVKIAKKQLRSVI